MKRSGFLKSVNTSISMTCPDLVEVNFGMIFILLPHKIMKE